MEIIREQKTKLEMRNQHMNTNKVLTEVIIHEIKKYNVYEIRKRKVLFCLFLSRTYRKLLNNIKSLI